MLVCYVAFQVRRVAEGGIPLDVRVCLVIETPWKMQLGKCTRKRKSDAVLNI